MDRVGPRGRLHATERMAWLPLHEAEKVIDCGVDVNGHARAAFNAARAAPASSIILTIVSPSTSKASSAIPSATFSSWDQSRSTSQVLRPVELIPGQDLAACVRRDVGVRRRLEESVA